VIVLLLPVVLLAIAFLFIAVLTVCGELLARWRGEDF